MALRYFLLIGIMLLVGCSEEHRQFSELRRSRKDTVQAQNIASNLKERPEAIELALRDFDCFGGTTRGWANWMLEYSSITTINASLKEILLNPKERHSRRVSAAWILWLRTHDGEHLQELFRLVKNPGGNSVQMGRRYLSMTTTNEVVRDALTINASNVLQVTEATFASYLRDREEGCCDAQ